MEVIIDSLAESVLYTSAQHKGYLISWKLIAPLCHKWSRNRDPDSSRVDEMVKYAEEGGYIPPIIHLAELSIENLVCYDGNHRREVFGRLTIDMMCIVDVMFNTKQEDVYRAFEALNKSVQLPAIYLGEETTTNVQLKNEIVNFVEDFIQKYKECYSTSARCQRPHFNKDTFMDNITEIHSRFRGHVSIRDIGKALEKLNEEYSKGNLCRPHSHYKNRAIAKCEKTSLWLFLEKTIPFDHVENILLSTK